MVEHLSDEKLQKLRRGGHDPEKVYAAYKAAVETQGQADGHPGQDDQGLRPGRSRRRPQRHAPAEEAQREGAARVPHAASAFRSPTTKWRKAPFYKPADDSAGDEISARPAARRWAASCPSVDQADADSEDAADRTTTREFIEGSGDREVSTTMAFVALLSASCSRTSKIGKYIVPIVPDESRTFGMEGAVPPVRHLRARRASCTSRSIPIRLLYYREAKDGQILEEGHHRSRLDVVVHRRRHRLRDARRQHDSVLHLLLDVRLPADRRLDLGRRRHAGQGLPARRHGRPHHAQRRRPAASGRPQPAHTRSPFPPCGPTTRPSPTKRPSSSSTA